MKAGEIKIVFKPVEDDAVWETLIIRTVTTVYRVRVPHSELNHVNTPDQEGLADKIKDRALELFDQQPEPEVTGGPATEIEFAHWALAGGAEAEQAREFYASEYPPDSQDGTPRDNETHAEHPHDYGDYSDVQ